MCLLCCVVQNRILFKTEDSIASFEKSDDFYERIKELAVKVEREVATMISSRTEVEESKDTAPRAMWLNDASDEDIVKLQKAVAKMKQLDRKLSDLVKVIKLMFVYT